jgi:hypothetical protein
VSCAGDDHIPRSDSISRLFHARLIYNVGDMPENTGAGVLLFHELFRLLK